MMSHSEQDGKIWVKHYPDEISEHLQYPDLFVDDLLKQAYEKHPENIAIRFMGKSMTYAELYRSAVACAHALRRMGIQQGDRVSVMLPNCPQYVISYFGILMAGAVVVQTNPLYVERELTYQLQDSGAETIIALDLVYPKIRRVQNKTNLKHMVITSIADYLPFPKNVLYPFVQKRQGQHIDIQYGENTYPFKKWLRQDLHALPDIQRSTDDTILLQYTGGTTGSPKGVKLSHRNIIVNTHQCSVWFYKADFGKERILGILPLFHVYGMTTVMNFSVYLASTMILMPKFEVEEALKTIAKEKPTIFPGAPTIYVGLINHPHVHTYDLSSIKACLSGSAPLPKDVQETFEALTNGKLVEGYGLSETSPVTHANLIWGRNVIGSIGIPWPDTEACILSVENRDVLPPGEIGELAVKGPQVMQGYLNREEETAGAFHDGWLLTGDMAYMDEEGYFYIVDRKKDMINASGFNVFPREVEEVLYEHEAVKECAVIGVADEYRGETVKAFIVCKDGRQVTEKELDQHCRQRLAAYKVPRLYEFREELPKTMVGKVLKRALKEESA